MNRSPQNSCTWSIAPDCALKERASDILDHNSTPDVALPKVCSFRDKGAPCTLPPSYIVSITDGGEEYMIAVVCCDHKDQMEKQIEARQSLPKIQLPNPKFQEMRFVVTDCIRTTYDSSF